jgi:hypothetical protein
MHGRVSGQNIMKASSEDTMPQREPGQSQMERLSLEHCPGSPGGHVTLGLGQKTRPVEKAQGLNLVLLPWAALGTGRSCPPGPLCQGDS